MNGWTDERADRYRARSGAVFLVRAAPLSVMECPSHHNRQAAAANDGGQARPGAGTWTVKRRCPLERRAVNGPRILKDCGPGLLAKKDLNRSLGPVLQRANIIA